MSTNFVFFYHGEHNLIHLLYDSESPTLSGLKQCLLFMLTDPVSRKLNQDTASGTFLPSDVCSLWPQLQRPEWLQVT